MREILAVLKEVASHTRGQKNRWSYNLCNNKYLAEKPAEEEV